MSKAPTSTEEDRQTNVERENDPPETRAQERARKGIVDGQELGEDEDTADIKALKKQSEQMNAQPPREAFKDQGNDPQYAFEHEVPKDIHGGDQNVPESINEPPGSDVIPPQSKEAMAQAERDLENQAQEAAKTTAGQQPKQQPGSEQEIADQRRQREQEQAQAQERSRGGRYAEQDDDDDDDEKGGKKGKKR